MILILQMKTNKQTGFEEDKWLMAQKWQSLYNVPFISQLRLGYGNKQTPYLSGLKLVFVFLLWLHPGGICASPPYHLHSRAEDEGTASF